PLAATLTTQRVFDAFLGSYEEMKTFFYGHSYCANPLGCAAAIASLEVFEESALLESLPEKVGAFRESLRRFESIAEVQEIRQCGLIAGIEVGPFDWQKQMGAHMCLAAREHGLLTRPVRDTLVLMPPPCSTHEELDQMAEALYQATVSTLKKI
ncbi:MAG: aminotransferase class III-fold pyridoxal phosphate-dependent enzyme, partial [Verrucomicrobiota bacterium]